MSAAKTIITKANGEQEFFDESKLRNSLKRAGATPQLIDEVIQQTQKQLHEGISTKNIYKIAFSILKQHKHGAMAARYNLKRALMDLGPSGYPFERYVGEILKQQGYIVEVGVLVEGKCVVHEVDVVAEKDDRHYMIECKFHNQPGHSTDVKVPLYINSRFLDVEHQWKKLDGHEHKFHQGWVVTNTRFTSDAIRYGECAGLYLLGWNYPAHGNLKQLIDASGLHPITALTTISGAEKIRLLDQGIIMSKDLCNHPDVLSKIGISEKRHDNILGESAALCRQK